MKLKFILLLLLITLPKIILAISKHDFAYIAEIQTHTNTPFYELEIPVNIYETITRVDLGDLRVLNGDGQVVPHGLRNAAIKTSSKKESQNIPFFPLYQQENQTITDLHLNIKRNKEGEVIDIKSSLPKNNNNRLTGYLLDLRQWKKPVDQLKIIWKQANGASFIRKLNIEKSSNLERWHSIASGKTLVNLSYQNHQLTENTITLATRSANYLRIMFADQKPGLELESIQAIHTQSSSHYQRNWQSVSITGKKNTGEYYFQHQLKSLVRQLEVKLPENNTVVEVRAASRANKETPWTFRGAALLYRLSVNGSNIEKSKININPSRDSDWMLYIDPQGGGIGSGLPDVKLQWQPQQLVFVARGRAPYRIVWGSAQIKPVLVNANQLLPASSINLNISGQNVNSTGMLSQAELLTDTIRSTNKKVLQPKEKEVNWQQWILWILLVSAAVMLIWMAIRLMKKMSES